MVDCYLVVPYLALRQLAWHYGSYWKHHEVLAVGYNPVFSIVFIVYSNVVFEAGLGAQSVSGDVGDVGEL